MENPSPMQARAPAMNIPPPRNYRGPQRRARSSEVQRNNFELDNLAMVPRARVLAGNAVDSNYNRNRNEGPREDLRFDAKARRNIDDLRLSESDFQPRISSSGGRRERRSSRGSYGGSRPRRASLTMKQAVDEGMIKKHDVTNFKMYDSRRVSVGRASSAGKRGIQRSANNLREYPNDRTQDVNGFQNFNASYKRDKFIHEYPVVTRSARSGDNRANYLYHSHKNERDTAFCGEGETACNLI